MKKYLFNEFEDVSPTLGLNCYPSIIHIKETNMDVQLQLWDLSGNRDFYGITKSYLRQAVGIIYVYDLANLTSLKNLYFENAQ